MKFIKPLHQFLNGFSEWTGRLIAWLVFAMMLVTTTVVVLRYGFDSGSIALQESISYMHAIVFMLGAAYTLKHNGHVRVDVFYRSFSQKTKAWVDIFGVLLFLFPLCIFIFISSWDFVMNSWAIHESSAEPGGIPAVYLLKSLIPVMMILLLFQGLSMILGNLLIILNKAELENNDD